MDKFDFIFRDNKEGLGKYFLKKAVDFALMRHFRISYEFFKEGLDFLTCDCGNWRKDFVESDRTILDDFKVKPEEKLEYCFVKAYLLAFESNKKDLYIGLDSIDKYLEIQEDEYGLYVKGKILLALEEPQDALINFYEAVDNFGENSRLLYRIGRANEQYLNVLGLDELYHSFDSNPSSACCARVLKKYMKQREIEFPSDSSSENELITSFLNPEGEWKFDSLYERYLNNEYLETNLLFDQIETLPIITSFIKEVRKNKSLFIIDDEEYYEDYDDYDYRDASRSAYDSPYYNDSLDMDQQSPEFWDSL